MFTPAAWRDESRLETPGAALIRRTRPAGAPSHGRQAGAGVRGRPSSQILNPRTADDAGRYFMCAGHVAWVVRGRSLVAVLLARWPKVTIIIIILDECC